MKNKTLFKTCYFFEKELPIKIFQQVAKIPGISNPDMVKKANLAGFVNKKIKEMYELFDHFVTN